MLRTKAVIRTDKTPKPRGPYSQGIEAESFVFVAGQLGMDPATGKLLQGIQEQTRQCLLNIKSILEDSGASLDGVVRTGVYLRNITDIDEMNLVYESFFPQFPPARTTIQASLARPDFLVEIDAIALKG
ncbi:MAG: RidA family protein [Nitrososphaerales archaeon]